MKCCAKLLDDDTQMVQDGLLEYLTESTDFLVVGCIGPQGVGKSTLLSHFAKPPDDPFDSENLIFKKQSKSQIDSSTHCTDGIDAYITDERVILLDSQPVLSLSVLVRHYNCEGNLSARSCSRDDPDYPCIESDMELLSLQYCAFLLTVCHVVVVVQDYSFNPQLIRFLQTAEMLKPSTGVHTDEDTLLEYFPHVVLVNNKSELSTFTKKNLHDLQEGYKKLFGQSQLPIQSGIGIANGNILKSLTPELCKSDPINLFLLPRFQKDPPSYENINYTSLVKDLRLQIYGLAPAPLTHTLLTEKNWWHYAGKIWEDIKKSTFFPEFGRLLPTPSSAKAEINQT
uniref:Protein SMG9 n=1 Tax=Triatoma infestans TaxID=30076 RepID=A0A023F8R7_TRIIF